MGLFDKLSNLIFEEDPQDDGKKKASSTSSKKGSWTDIFFEDTTQEESPKKKKKSFSDLFFEDVPEQEDDIQSTFISGDDKMSVLDDISSKIEHRESELINLSDFFKAVNPKDYPDCAPEYEAYISLVKQLNALKDLAANSSKSSSISSMSSYQLEGNFRKFELDYQAHINAIKSLCYLSEISALNTQMQAMFSSHFTPKTSNKIAQTEGYIALISKNSSNFDKKYSGRLYKELIEAEYRLTILKLMNELKNGKIPRRNPFSSFSAQKKKTFETYLSKDLRDTNNQYNTIADNRLKYTKYNLVSDEFFDQLDADAEMISERIDKYSIDDFLLNELFENGDGFESLRMFLAFKLNLNFVDSKTPEANQNVLDETYRKATSGRSTASVRRTSTGSQTSKKDRKFPNYDDDL